MLHNRYAVPGGEDVSTATETELLRSAGHEVDLWELSNDSIAGKNMLAVSAQSIWSQPAAKALSERLRTRRYDIMHVQNYFPQFSPVVHRVARRHGVPSIQHLRNFRHTCVSGGLFRDGQTCQDCLGSFVPWKGVALGCYRDSRAGSAVVAAMIGAHKLAGTWTRSVGKYIAISEYVRDIHVRAGIPANKIVVRPNVVIPSKVSATEVRRNVFVAARLSPEKGVQTVIEAWKAADHGDHALLIAGSGPMEADLRAMAGEDPSIIFLGQISATVVGQEMARAKLIIVPSLWQEPFGRTALEAMTVGTPVVASNVGGLPDVVGHAGGGIYDPGDAVSLSLKITAFLESANLWNQVRDAQADRCERRFSPLAILRQTEAIYESSILSLKKTLGFDHA